jgi:cytochrome c-type biogenesis protein CcmE
MDQTSIAASSARRAKFLIGAAVVALTLVGLVGWAMSRPQATAFYMSVPEVQAMGATPRGDVLRVNGKVVPGSIERRGLETTFAIRGAGNEMVITTDQPMPDAFRNGSEVVARGRFDGELFSASEVLAKCPSKFKAA